MQSLKWLMGLNVVLGVLAYRDLLTFKPAMYSDTNLSQDVEQYLFAPTETAPLLIVLLSLWMVHHRRAELFALPKRGGSVLFASAALAVGCAIFTWAAYTRAPDIQALSLIANLAGCLVLWRGFAAVRVAAVPLLILLFAVPLPSPVIAQTVWEFQLATAQLAGWLLYVLGIPAVVTAEVIQLPLDTYQVIESCSGLRSVQTLAMFSILMATLFDRSKLHASVMFAAAFPIAFFMNGLRVLTLILNPHSEIHSVHVAQGLVILIGGLTMLYILDGLLPRILSSERTEVRPAAAGREASAVAPEGLGLGRALAVTFLTVTLVGVLYLLPTWQYHGRGSVGVAKTFDALLTEWESEELPVATNDLARVSFRQSHRKSYSHRSASANSGGRLFGTDAPIEVFLGVGEHLDRFKSPFSPKNALPGRGWEVEDVGQIRLEGTEAEISWRLLRSGTHRVISYHWYEEHRGLVEESLRSLFAIDRSPFARELPVMAVRIATEIDEASPKVIRRAHSRLEEFHSLMVPVIEYLKEGPAVSASRVYSRPIDCPLWEIICPHAIHGHNLNPSEIRCLHDAHPVA